MAPVAVRALDPVGDQAAELRLELGVADDGPQLLDAVRKLATDRKEEM
jgi:hypothetical protein